MNYQKDERLSRLIENKSVALVAPAPYLVGKKLGKIINEYDVVCRINYIAPGDFTDDYGDRTDIMFYNCATASLEKAKSHFEDNPDFGEKLKLVVCPVVKAIGPDNWQEWDSDYVSPVVNNFKSINVHGNDFCWVGLENYKYLIDIVGYKEPNAGFLSMLVILEHCPKELFITGFAFYKDAAEKGIHFPGYAHHKPYDGKPKHAQGPQINCFKKHILSHGNVKIDSYLKNLLGLKHKNVQNL